MIKNYTAADNDDGDPNWEGEIRSEFVQSPRGPLTYNEATHAR